MYCRLLALTALIWAATVDHLVVFGDYEVVVGVHSYNNPSGRCEACHSPGDAGPRCCDADSFTLSCPSPTCDTIVNYCLRPLGQVGLGCLLEQFISSRVFFRNTNSFLFGSSFFGLPNPETFTRDGAWMGIQILFISIDCGESTTSCSNPEHIDSIPVNINITVGTRTPEREYVGSAGLARLNVSFGVRCTEDFYGEDCLTECTDFVSCAECGLPGYTGIFCQIDIDDCIDVNCNNGSCIDEVNGFHCECDAGYTGESCLDNTDDCESIDCNNGDCIDEVNGFHCECNAGYTGEYCLNDINDCENASCNNGGCVDEVNGFRCECNAGYTGEFCHSDTNDCEGVDCNNNGICMDGVDSFTCMCNPGFTGDMCQEVDTATTRQDGISVGVIAGGVIGGLIAVILLAIVAVIVFIAVLKVRSRKITLNHQSYLPGDNPSYDAVVNPKTAQIAPTHYSGNNNGKAENLAGTSAEERDFDNPLYASNSVEAEPHYSIPGPPDPDHIYTIPGSPPRSNHCKMEGDKERSDGGVPGPETGPYYSVVK